jgi:hypothetical protein
MLGGLAAQACLAGPPPRECTRLGPSIAVPITQGARSLLAVGGALLFLGETLTVQKLIGLLAIVASGWHLTRFTADTRFSGFRISGGSG